MHRFVFIPILQPAIQPLAGKREQDNCCVSGLAQQRAGTNPAQLRVYLMPEQPQLVTGPQCSSVSVCPKRLSVTWQDWNGRSLLNAPTGDLGIGLIFGGC